MKQPLIAPGLFIVTPAHNEVETLFSLVRSIDAQQVRPGRWIIVDDRSTDGTAEFVERLAATRPWITVAKRTERHHSRDFGQKVAAFDAGYAAVRSQSHQLIGVLDADVVLPPDYYARIVEEFERDPMLGLVGGRYRLPDGTIGKTGGNSVPGTAAVMRTEAFQQVGGFQTLPNGGEDAVLGYQMRARGWHTTCVADLVYAHNRVMGSEGRGPLATAFELGRRDRTLENPMAFELLKVAACLIRGEPFMLGGIARGAGYLHGRLTETSCLDPVTRQYVTQEQTRRLYRWTAAPVPSSPSATPEGRSTVVLEPAAGLV